MSTTVPRRGQFANPKPVRDLLGPEPGSAVGSKATGEEQVPRLPTETKKPASRFFLLRGVATVKMSADEIMALTRGDD